MVARGGIEPPTRGFSVRSRRFQELINQPLAALASPDPSLTQAQSRHTQSELVTFPAQRRLRPDSILGTEQPESSKDRTRKRRHLRERVAPRADLPTSRAFEAPGYALDAPARRAACAS